MFVFGRASGDGDDLESGSSLVGSGDDKALLYEVDVEFVSVRSSS